MVSTVKQSESNLNARFLDLSGKDPNGPSHWAPVKISRQSIEEAIARLADRPVPANGRRAMSIVHPSSAAPGLGLAPGVDVVINVLKPGESTRPMRRNANQAEICIRGSGTITVKDKKIELSKWDVCNIPSMQTFTHRNTGDDLWVRLTYSNAPLLEKMGVNYFEVDPKPAVAVPRLSERHRATPWESGNAEATRRMPRGNWSSAKNVPENMYIGMTTNRKTALILDVDRRPTAQAAVITAVTSWSLASSGGGAGRSFLLT